MTADVTDPAAPAARRPDAERAAGASGGDAVATVPSRPGRTDARHATYRDGAEPFDAREARRFVVMLLMATVAGLVLVGGFTLFVDPTGITGRTTRWQTTGNSAVREQKLDLIAAAEPTPDVIFYGSSRSMKIDPADLRPGVRGFNAAVSGGIPRDTYLLASYAADEVDGRFPHMVWGLDVDSFREKQAADTLSQDPRVRDYLPWRERATSRAEALSSGLEMQTVRIAVKAVALDVLGRRRAAVEEPPEAPGLETGTPQVGDFADNGFQEWIVRWKDADGVPVGLAEAIEIQMRDYVGFVFKRDEFSGIEDGPSAYFERAIRVANQHGDTPTVWVTPYHPDALELMKTYDFQERRREFLDHLESLQQRGDLRFEIADFSDLDEFGGDPDEFYDGIHMTPENTGRVVAELDRRGLLDSGGA